MRAADAPLWREVRGLERMFSLRDSLAPVRGIAALGKQSPDLFDRTGAVCRHPHILHTTFIQTLHAWSSRQRMATAAWLGDTGGQPSDP